MNVRSFISVCQAAAHKSVVFENTIRVNVFSMGPREPAVIWQFDLI
jgi:hypothetical protein